MSAYVGIQPSLRTATKADIPLLLTVREQTMSEYLLASGVEPTEEDQIQRVLARFDCAQIILLANQPIGLLKIVRDGKQWELVQIQIVPEKQGGGIGTQLVQKLLSDAVATKASVSLSVLKRTLLLKEQRMPRMPTDITGRLWKPFSAFDIDATIRHQIDLWAIDLGLSPQAQQYLPPAALVPMIRDTLLHYVMKAADQARQSELVAQLQANRFPAPQLNVRHS